MFFARFLVSLISNIRESIFLPVCKEGIALLPRGERCVWSRPPAYLHGSVYIAWKVARLPKLQARSTTKVVVPYNYRSPPHSEV